MNETKRCFGESQGTFLGYNKLFEESWNNDSVYNRDKAVFLWGIVTI